MSIVHEQGIAAIGTTECKGADGRHDNGELGCRENSLK